MPTPRLITSKGNGRGSTKKNMKKREEEEGKGQVMGEEISEKSSEALIISSL